MRYHNTNRKNLPLPGEEPHSDNLPNSEASVNEASDGEDPLASLEEDELSLTISSGESASDSGSNFLTSPARRHRRRSGMYRYSSMGAELSRGCTMGQGPPRPAPMMPSVTPTYLNARQDIHFTSVNKRLAMLNVRNKDASGTGERQQATKPAQLNGSG